MPITLYSCRQKDLSTGRWRVLRWKMTEPDAAEHARVYGVEVEKVPGSEDVREDLRGQGALSIHPHCTEAIEAYFGETLPRLGSAPAEEEQPG